MVRVRIWRLRSLSQSKEPGGMWRNCLFLFLVTPLPLCIIQFVADDILFYKALYGGGGIFMYTASAEYISAWRMETGVWGLQLSTCDLRVLTRWKIDVSDIISSRAAKPNPLHWYQTQTWLTSWLKSPYLPFGHVGWIVVPRADLLPVSRFSLS